MNWRDEFYPFIVAAATKYKLDPFVLEGLIEQESRGNPNAIRFEPNYKWTVPFANTSASATTEIQQQKTSWGLCQVMGGLAREMGCIEPFLSVLCEPVMGVHYGARHLAKCIRQANGVIGQGLLRYNGGGNPNYGVEVLARAEKMRR